MQWQMVVFTWGGGLRPPLHPTTRNNQLVVSPLTAEAGDLRHGHLAIVTLYSERTINSSKKVLIFLPFAVYSVILSII